MTPTEYINEIVEPTIREFHDERRCRRRAYLACIVTYHITDYLENVLEKAGEDKQQVRRKMKEACPDAFESVRSICNGTKHVETDKRHVIPFKAGSDWDRPQCMAGIGQVGISRCGDADGGREVQAGDRSLDLYGCVKTLALAFQREFPAHLSGCDLNLVVVQFENLPNFQA